MIREITGALFLAAACSPSTPATDPAPPPPAPVAVAQPPPPEVPPRNTWIADIRDEAAYLHFGYPNSGNIRISLLCGDHAGRFTIRLPSVGKSEISLSSGSVSAVFPATIDEGTEGWEDTVLSTEEAAVDTPVFAAFRAAGVLSAAEPDRNFDATTPEEKAEIERFFVACPQIEP